VDLHGGDGGREGERETKLELAFVNGDDLPPQLRVGGWGHCDRMPSKGIVVLVLCLIQGFESWERWPEIDHSGCTVLWC
jgi:hypothetical protein